jgi:hypothetical protein
MLILLYLVVKILNFFIDQKEEKVNMKHLNMNQMDLSMVDGKTILLDGTN